MADVVDAAAAAVVRRDRPRGELTAQADAVGQTDRRVSVDSTINGVHQHATSITYPDKGEGARSSDTTPPDRLRESAGQGIGWPRMD